MKKRSLLVLNRDDAQGQMIKACVVSRAAYRHLSRNDCSFDLGFFVDTSKRDKSRIELIALDDLVIVCLID